MMILRMSFSASILIIVITIIRIISIHKLPKKTFLILWWIALYRLLIPYFIPSRFSIYNLIYILEDMFLGVKSSITSSNITSIVDRSTIANGISVTGAKWLTSEKVSTFTDTSTTTAASISAFQIVWIAGVVVWALLFLVSHLRCRINYKETLHVNNEFVNKWLKKHQIKRNIQIRQSDKIITPLTYGIWKPVILLPKTTDWTNEAILQYILAHEYIHIKRFDILFKWVLACALCIHWFNPLVWIMYVLANRDIEIYCDESVIRMFGRTSKSDYALALIKLEEKKSKLIPVLSNFSKNAIEERIVAIMKMRKTTIYSMLIAVLLVAGSSIVFATSALKQEDLGMFEKALGDDAKKYAQHINKVTNETAKAVTEDYTIYIDSVIFTDHNVYAIIGIEGDVPESFALSGKIARTDYEWDIYKLKGDLKEIETIDGVRYFFYSAIIGPLDREDNKDTDPMLVLAAGDFYKRSSLRNYEGGNLELRVNIGNREHILTTTISNVAINALIFNIDPDSHGGVYYSKLIITPWDIEFYGNTDKTYTSYDELDRQLYIKLTIVLSGGRKINFSYDSRGTIYDEGYPLGMSRGTTKKSEFYHWWDSVGWELDLDEVKAIVLNGKTYKPNYRPTR